MEEGAVVLLIGTAISLGSMGLVAIVIFANTRRRA